MSTNPSTPRRPLWRRLLVGFAIAMAVSAAIVGYSIHQVLTLSQDALALREAVVADLDPKPEARVQISASPALLGAARLCLHFLDDVPDEARLALSAVRTASVGVYEWRPVTNPSGLTSVLQAADRAMARRGWSRVVLVANPRETVLVYAPSDAGSARSQRFCLAVCHDDQLVVVAGAADPGPLLELISQHRKLASL